MKKIKLINILAVMVLCYLFIFACSKLQDNHDESIASGVFSSQPIWNFETSEAITSNITGDSSGKIYVRTSKSLVALDSNTGIQLWQIETPSRVPLSFPPKVYKDYILVPEEDSRIALYSLKDGQLIWNSKIIDVAIDRSITARIESIEIANQMVFVARFDWNLSAYDLANGQIVWEEKSLGRNPPYLAVQGDTVYLGIGSLLHAYEASSGALLWQQDILGFSGPILTHNNMLYVTDEKNSTVLAIDLDNQNIVWKKYYSEIENFEIGCVRIYDDTLYIAAKKLIAVSAIDGTKLWATEEIGRLECPVILDGNLYVRNTGSLLFGFEVQTGQEIGRLSVQENTRLKHELNRSPYTTEKLLIIPISENKVVAYRP